MLTLEEYMTKHYEAVGDAFGYDNVFAVMLYGSQNYVMDDENSDVDTKAMVLPSFGSFALRRKYLSMELSVDGALSNVKDVRAMCENFLKSNINFLECLFTEDVIVNEDYFHFWQQLIEKRDFLANAAPLRVMHAAHGMAQQKFAALTKPFESKQEVLAKYGYDPKQLYHLRRLEFFMLRYFETGDFGDSLVPNTEERKELWRLKRGELSLPEAKQYAQECISRCTAMLKPAADRFPKNVKREEEAKEWYDNFCLAILREHLTKELLAGRELEVELPTFSFGGISTMELQESLAELTDNTRAAFAEL